MTIRKLKAALQWLGVIIFLGATVVAVVTKAPVWIAVSVAGIVAMVAFGDGQPAPSGPPNDWYKY